MDPKYLFNENVKNMTPDDVQFDMSYIIVATGIAGIVLAALMYFLLSNLKKSAPADFQGSSTQLRSRPNRLAQERPDGIVISADDTDDEEIVEEKKTKKIGVKKAAKLEAKAEKRAAYEAMLRDREEKKREQEYQDTLRLAQENKERQEEAEREEKERIAREEQAKKDHEAYLELAATFEIQDEGHEETEADSEDKLKQFIEHIKREKVVLLDQLAATFKMRTKDVIDRILNLLENGSLVGIIDDRGKFICVTNEELQSVAKFIRQRGRVSVYDLYINSNKLINLKPESVSE